MPSGIHIMKSDDSKAVVDLGLQKGGFRFGGTTGYIAFVTMQELEGLGHAAPGKLFEN